ncbi:protease complex subunit PrcB family protein [Gilvimarinus japonicus]|uniref:Protease complex subunit PrcB family protein n=1 Tax=Gilvimarinus japonicus TaxID=1796469 RepID=A0ABV7HWF7_9GAMM
MIFCKRLPLIFICTALASCGSDDKRDDSSVTFTSLACPTVPGNSSIKEPETEVINDPHRYLERYMSADLNSQDSPPHVDFDTRTVLAVYSGMKTSGGHSVAITEIRESDEAITVNYVDKEPGGACGVDGALTYPYCFVSTAKINKPVTFSSKTKTVDCD